MEVRLEVENSLLFLEIPKVVDAIPGQGFPELDRPGSLDFEPVSLGRSEHLCGEIPEAPSTELRFFPWYLD